MENNESGYAYQDPDDHRMTLGGLLENLDFEFGKDSYEQSPFPGDDTTITLSDDSHGKVDYDSIEKEAAEIASRDPEALQRAIDSMVKTAEEEYILTEEELYKAKDNLAEFHRDVEEAIENGKPIPDNYMETSLELLQNIKEQQDKLSNLQPRLEALHNKQIKTKNALPEHSSKNFAKTTAFVKASLQTYINGIRSLGDMLYKKNQEFTKGIRSSMKDIGDKAEAIYGRTLVRLQEVTKSFKESVERTGTEIKNKAAETRERIGERTKSFPVMSLSEQLKRAEEKAARAKEIAGEGRSPLRNAMYFLALENAKKVQSELSQLVDSRVSDMENRLAEGKPVDLERLDTYKNLQETLNHPGVQKQWDPSKDILDRAGSFSKSVMDARDAATNLAQQSPISFER